MAYIYSLCVILESDHLTTFFLTYIFGFFFWQFIGVWLVTSEYIIHEVVSICSMSSVPKFCIIGQTQITGKNAFILVTNLHCFHLFFLFKNWQKISFGANGLADRVAFLQRLSVLLLFAELTVCKRVIIRTFTASSATFNTLTDLKHQNSMTKNKNHAQHGLKYMSANVVNWAVEYYWTFESYSSEVFQIPLHFKHPFVGRKRVN